MSKPLIVRNKDTIIISYNGKKLIQPIEKYQNMTNEEIIKQFIKVRSIKNNKK